MTVITPEALVKSGLQPCKLGELESVDADESWYFIFPSRDAVNEYNGDGDLLKIHDYARDCSSIETSKGTFSANADTIVYYWPIRGSHTPGLLRKVHQDEKGAVSLETILVVALIALPILIFLYNVGWPRIRQLFFDGIEELDEGRDEFTGGRGDA